MQDDRISSSLGHALVRAFRRVNRAHNRALKPLGLTAEQAHVLMVLWTEGPMKVGDLQRTLMLSSGTLTGAVDRMEKAGLVRRVPDPRDGRAFLVEPAAVDKKQRRAIERTIEDTEEETFASFDTKERRTLLALLERIP